MIRELASVILALAAAAPVRAQTAAVQGSRSGVSSLAPGTTREKRFDQLGVVVRVWSEWPDMLYQGCVPIVLEVDNAGDREHTASFVLTRGFGDDTCEVRESITVQPRTREQRVVFGAVGRGYENSFRPFVTVAGEREHMAPVGPTQPCDMNIWPVLFVGAPSSAPGAAFTEAASKALTEHEPANAPLRPAEAAPKPVSHGLGYVFYPSRPAAVASWNVAVLGLGADQLPATWEAYTSVKGVILDADAALPRSDVLDALAAWTRLGGCLVIYGDRAIDVTRKTASFAPWFEPRFRMGGRELDAEHGVYRCAQGVLVVASGRALDPVRASEPAADDVVFEISRGLATPRPIWGSPQHEGRIADAPRISGLDMPYRALTLLLVLFAIVIGPVNMIVVRRLRRPVLLLVTVPVIAIAFSLSIFAYGALAQGLGTRVTSLSLTWLDQRAHSSSTNEVRSVFAGMPVGGGWRPGPGAACFAQPEQSRYPASAGHLSIDFTDGVTYGDDYLPVRRETRLSFAVDRAARARLVVTRTAAGIEVENGLGERVHDLALRTLDGTAYVLEGTLEPGARATLVTANEDSFVAQLHSARLGSLFVDDGSLHGGTYFARLEHSPFTDDGGVDYDVEAGSAFVTGVFDEERSGR